MNDDEHRAASGAKSPHRLALHAILVNRAIDDREPTEDDIRLELRRGGIEAPTSDDVAQVFDAFAAGDRERADYNQHLRAEEKGNPDA